MRSNTLESPADTEFGDTDRTIPRARSTGPGHPSAWARAPRIEWCGTQRDEPSSALRILAEPALIDAAFVSNPPGWGDFDPVVMDILMGRR